MKNSRGCYIIAAVDLTHNGQLSTAKKLIDVAVESGCDAVKFQRRNVRYLVVESVLRGQLSAFPEFGNTYEEVFSRLEFSQEDHLSLRSYCSEKIDFLLAPLDLQSLSLSVELEVDGYKVDPQCATDIPLLEAVAKQRKRVIASVGMCSGREVADLVRVLSDCELTLLSCVACEPALIGSVNLNAMSWLSQFGYPVGYADTTEGCTVGPVAVALGATVIEKRITLNRDARGFNHAVSLEPGAMRSYVEKIRGIEQAVKRPPIQEILPCEARACDEERKSIVAAAEIRAGTVLERTMVICKAPLRGLTPNFIPYLIGKKVLYDLKPDDPITFGVIE